MSTTLTVSRRALIRSAISAIFLSCSASAIWTNSLDPARPDQLVQAADRADAEDLSPVLVLPVDRQQHGVVDEGGHVEGVFGGGVAQEEPGGVARGCRRRTAGPWRGPAGRARGRGSRRRSGPGPPGRCVRSGAGPCRAGCASRSTPPPRCRRAAGDRMGRSRATSSRICVLMRREVGVGHFLHPVEPVQVAVPEGVPDHQAPLREDAPRGHREQEAQRFPVDVHPGPARQVDGRQHRVHDKGMRETHDLVVGEHRHEGERRARESPGRPPRRPRGFPRAPRGPARRARG